MEKITNHFCDYIKDQKRLMDFWLNYRAASDVRMYPTIWRFRLLLTSRVLDQEKDTQIWVNEFGQIVGLVMLWRRKPTSPYIVVDSFARPAFVTEEFILGMLKWGNQRAVDIAVEQKSPFTIYAVGFSQYDFADPLLKQLGYALLTPNPEEHDVYFARTLKKAIINPSFLPGYAIRRLRNMDDLDSYQSLYGFAKVNPNHQKELLESDEYSHLVVVNPVGEFVAYCECSICRVEWQITNQRIGWIDYVETKPDQQRKGLGRSALLAGLSQLQKWGADTAMLITINTNVSAVNLYTKTGFKSVDIFEHPSYQKQIAI